ncbi:unnamed protein product [Closterium sp. NIES-64]|nr:unnamed protein product [Closterium sp. NIES-64]
MVKWHGFACAAAAAIGHSGIDATRKYASQTLSSAELVTLVGILDALFLSSFILAFRLVTDLRFVTWKLLQILVASSAAKILAGVMYQRALHVAPISTTVPFLAFVPVLLLATSFLLLGMDSPDLRAEADLVLGSDIALDLSFGQRIDRAVSERHSGSGLRAEGRAGNAAGEEEREEVTAGGGRNATLAGERTGESRQRSFTEGSSSSEIVAGGGFGGGRGFYSRASRGRFGTGLGIGLGSAHHPQEDGSAQSSPATSGGRAITRGDGARGETGEVVGEGEKGGGEGKGGKRESVRQQQEATAQQGATPGSAGGVWRTRSGRRRGGWMGAWLLVVLQQVWGAVVGGKEERDVEAGRRGWVKVLVSKTTRVRLLLGAVLAPLGKRVGIVWQYLHGPVKRLRVVVTAWARAPMRVVARVVRVPWVVVKGALRWVGAQKRHEGPLLMMGCAVLLSFTNGCDKLGVHHSPSVVVFAGLQRLFMAVPPVLYLAATRPSAFPLLLKHFPLLAGISACEITAIVFYLQSLHWLLVSYSVAVSPLLPPPFPLSSLPSNSHSASSQAAAAQPPDILGTATRNASTASPPRAL